MVSRMEASETVAVDSSSVGKRDAASAAVGDVEGSTLPTTEPAIPQPVRVAKEKDGSVISAMTDPASVDNPLPHESSGMRTSHFDVPKQVILPEDASSQQEALDASSPSEINDPDRVTTETPLLEQTPLLVTVDTTTLDRDANSTVSTSALPDPKPALHVPELTNQNTTRSTTSEEATTRIGNVTMNDSTSFSDGLDDYIRSPEVQNAIVERSPGGRYVRFMEKLGSGASKDVYRAYDTQEGIEVAWNVVNLAGVPKTERNRIVNEVRLLERLHHHNIISFHGSWVNRERQEVNFVTEILSSGTLKSFINKVQVIRWKIAKRWAVQILNGLEYLHSQDPPVIHRDLKCENIFINGTSGDLRIGDLGLSTVHRNGRVLSVLGTPEFMAPDMYEESSYDEKVDVYAFGMCMLEIFTKEIPYSECRNPAQIYKKVSSGEQPEVLSRLQSKHARDFVLLCLGYKDENGNYVRPTVAELLKHPFLVKRSNDDDEVVVDPPLRERTITEASAESFTTASLAQPPRRQQAKEVSIPKETSPEPTPKPSRTSTSTNSLDDSDGDRFEEMQESEISMRRVKVLMGRGQELEEEEDDSLKQANAVEAGVSSSNAAIDTQPNNSFSDQHAAQPDSSRPQQHEHQTNTHLIQQTPQQQQQGNGHVIQHNQSTGYLQQAPQQGSQIMQQQAPPGGQVLHQQPGNNQMISPPAQHQIQREPSATAPNQHYLVAAAVIEHENPNIRPYADDILKLVVTLPVDGQTQNVQFDFHLVEDDPVQVAKEMVEELGIPLAAVLEISETISGLARTARMKQDRHAIKLQQNSQGQPSHPQYPQGVAHPNHHLPHQGSLHSGMPQDQGQFHAQNVQQGSSQNDQIQFQRSGQQQGSSINPTEHMQYQNNTQQQGHHMAQHPGGIPSSGSQDQGSFQNQSPHQSQQQMHPGSVSGAGPPDQNQYNQNKSQSLVGQNEGITENPSSQDHSPFQQHNMVQPLHQTYAQSGPTSDHQHYAQESSSYQQTSQDHIQYQQQAMLHSSNQVQQGAGSQNVASSSQQDNPQYQYHGTILNGHLPEDGQTLRQVPPSRDYAVNGLPPRNLQEPRNPQEHTSQLTGQTVGQEQSYSQEQHFTQPHGLPYHPSIGSEGSVQNQTLQEQGSSSQPSSQNQHFNAHYVSGAPSQAVSSSGEINNHAVAQHSSTQFSTHGSLAASTPNVLLPTQNHDNDSSSSDPMQRNHAIQNNQSQHQSMAEIPQPTASNLADDGSVAVAQYSMESLAFLEPGQQVLSSHLSRTASSPVTSRGSLTKDLLSNDDSDDDDGGDDVDDELRKIEEEFQRNLQRAKKVFDNRMDNLQRSQVEREAQHQKTLERHQKERADYERRLAQEMEQQNRRMEQLQRDLEKRRELLAQNKRKQKGKNGIHHQAYSQPQQLQQPQQPNENIPESAQSSSSDVDKLRSNSISSNNF